MTATEKFAGTIPSEKLIQRIASHLDVIGDPTRLKILYAIAGGEVGLTELSRATAFSMPAVSHHLRLLKDKGLIRKRKDGVKVFYRLVDSCLLDVLYIARRHIEEEHTGR